MANMPATPTTPTTPKAFSKEALQLYHAIEHGTTQIDHASVAAALGIPIRRAHIEHCRLMREIRVYMASHPEDIGYTPPSPLLYDYDRDAEQASDYDADSESEPGDYDIYEEEAVSESDPADAGLLSCLVAWFESVVGASFSGH